MKLLLKLFFFILILLASIFIVNALLFTPKEKNIPELTKIKINTDQVKNRLAEALKFKTISNQDRNNFAGDNFLAMQTYLKKTYPLVFTKLKVERVNQYSLLLTWQGSNPALKPVLFLAHQDVVPVPKENIAKWTHPAFAGVIDENYIWGRGALDDKSSLLGILEAVNFLLAEGVSPQRTFYLAFGHDEEVGGEQGAAKIASLLQSRGISLEFVLDEGGVIADGVIPGIKPLVAMVGIAEKGYVSLELSVTSEGGHSSMPPKHTAVGILSQAIVNLEASPFPTNTLYTDKLFDTIGRYMPFTNKLIFANSWLMKPLITHQLAQNKLTNSMIRTTTAATVFHGGVKDNVLPVSAKAIVNFRILPGETVESVKEYVVKTIDNPNIKVEGQGKNPSYTSPVDVASFELLTKTIHQANGQGDELVVTPYLVMAGTDSRHFEKLTNNIYRFLFNYTKPDDIKRLHNVDERISIDNYTKVIQFYYQLIKNANQAF